ncbi:hypothetical protein F5887DRAFT_925397 [Amanita rubescens]|nr:hypothetical protein F5887DRAFT_925397 [Amanita rubescens]
MRRLTEPGDRWAESPGNSLESRVGCRGGRRRVVHTRATAVKLSDGIQMLLMWIGATEVKLCGVGEVEEVSGRMGRMSEGGIAVLVVPDAVKVDRRSIGRDGQDEGEIAVKARWDDPMCEIQPSDYVASPLSPLSSLPLLPPLDSKTGRQGSLTLGLVVLVALVLLAWDLQEFDFGRSMGMTLRCPLSTNGIRLLALATRSLTAVALVGTTLRHPSGVSVISFSHVERLVTTLAPPLSLLPSDGRDHCLSPLDTNEFDFGCSKDGTLKEASEIKWLHSPSDETRELPPDEPGPFESTREATQEATPPPAPPQREAGKRQIKLSNKLQQQPTLERFVIADYTYAFDDSGSCKSFRIWD